MLCKGPVNHLVEFLYILLLVWICKVIEAFQCLCFNLLIIIGLVLDLPVPAVP